MFGMEFYIDPSRCIGCQACLKACEECDTHRGVSMINFDFVDRRDSIATAAYVCWHCDTPTCAQVCPADALKKYEDGIVGSSLKPRCIGCSNCMLACPFGIPKLVPEYEQMMKCDMCYDRTSIGKRPMYATVCPSQALAYVTQDAIAAGRREKPVNTFWFGTQKITTKVYMMAPSGTDAIAIDVADYTWEGEGITSFAMLAGNLWIFARSLFHRAPSYPAQAVAALDEIPVGGVKLFTYPTAQDPCILVRTAADSFVAFSQMCTHLSCAVYYSKDENRLECPCHQGFFSIADGSVLQGPPQRPLPRVALEKTNGRLVAVRMEGEGA